MRVLGIDPGGKRLGIAVGDTLTGVVTPQAIVPYRGYESAAAAVAAAAAELEAGSAVIGLPTDADGEETAACARSRKLAGAVEALGVPVHLHPEFLSSNEARRRAHAAGRRTREPVDDIAAAVILEDFMASAEDVSR